MIELVNEANTAIDVAVREIVSTAHRPEGSYVSLPVLYPSGSTVVVRVSGGPAKFLVTDFGMGHTEAEMMGCDRIYVRQARAIAQKSGVGFDEDAFFAVQVSQDQLAGAIITVGNCSSEAVAVSAFKLAEKTATDASEFLISKLETAFGHAQVSRKEKLVGASNHEWEFAAAVKDGRRTSLFEFATKHPNSVANVAMKMGDIALLGHAPRRIVMVHSKVEMGTYLGVLAHSASIVEETVSVDQIRKLAEAA